MSELIIQNKNPLLRRQLLITVSALALTACVVPAIAEEASRPAVWIELGAQYEEMTGKNDPFVPPFDAAGRAQGFPSITDIENALGKGFGGEGSLSFQPHGSDWIFMASARYGRTHSPRHVLAQKILVGPPFGQYLTPGGKHLKTGGGSNYLATPTLVAYGVQNVNNSESHAVVDFQVGKDVGLGLFGRGTQSVFGFGARYVQMNTSSRANSHTLPDAQFHVIPNPVFQGKYSIQQTHYESALTMERYSNLHALGPALSLKNSTGLIGNVEEGEISLEWGVNLAVLFGRQRTHVEHQTTTKVLNYANVRTAHTTGNHRTASRRVTIPNVGGFAAVSYRFTNAKVSAGYRADFFFGALDRGLDTRNDTAVGFHGPFATVSFGLGG